MRYKYLVTVGTYPHFIKMVRSNSLKKSEDNQTKLAREYKNEQVDLFEWNYITNKWEHLSLVAIG
jgi:hypothetical protein|tara:strand:- start:397 stop:591 length:195 start_codon:yes stop_codon:yes gene_type:complete